MNRESVAIEAVLASAVWIRAQSGSQKRNDVNPQNTAAPAMQYVKPGAMVMDHSHEFKLCPTAVSSPYSVQRRIPTEWLRFDGISRRLQSCLRRAIFAFRQARAVPTRCLAHV